MSSAHGEAENGRAKSVNDEEEEEEEKDLPAGTPDGAYNSAQAATTTVESGPNDDAAMSEDSAHGSPRFSLDGLEKDQKSAVEPNGPGLLPVGLDRPSSADGSFSIPDDTPSVQVCTSMKIVGQQTAKRYIRARWHPTRRDVFILQSTAKVPHLHYVRSIVDFKLACPPQRTRLEHRRQPSSIYTLDSHLQAILFKTYAAPIPHRRHGTLSDGRSSEGLPARLSRRLASAILEDPPVSQCLHL